MLIPDAVPVPDAGPIEDCTNRVDDDGDGDADCFDSDCRDLELCRGSCGSPIAIGPGTTMDTVSDRNFAQGLCQAWWGGNDRVYVFVPTESQLSVSLSYGDDPKGVIIRTDCLDGESQVVCLDGLDDLRNHIPVSGQFGVQPGRPLYIIVGASDSEFSDGTFVLTVN